MIRLLPILLGALLAGCYPNGEWIPTVWGGEALDDAAAPELAGVYATSDGCTVQIDRFVVTSRGGALLTPEGTASAVLPGDQLYDLVQPGPHSMASILMRRGAYPEIALLVGPAEGTSGTLVGRGQLTGIDNAASDANPIRGNARAEDRARMEEAGAAALLVGSLDCGADTVAIDLAIDDEVGLLRCPVGSFEIPGGSFGVTQLVVRGESLLQDGAATLTLDDGDGVVTMVDVEAAGEARALRERLRAAWEADGGACAWEAVDPS
jgi:hypothetical protein